MARVVAHSDGGWARFRGEAVWASEGLGLRCVEEGVLEQGVARYPARRETLWRAGPTGIAVAFADGRPFHLIEGRHGLHACPPDLYRFAYDFSASGFWSVRWQVTGPRKAYRAITRYVRP